MVNWKEAGAQDRLVAALLAAHQKDIKLNYGEIAAIYGQGATYDAVEGRFRKVRKQAEQLLSEAINRGVVLGTNQRPSRVGSAVRSGVAGLNTNPSTPRSSGGRVSKIGSGGGSAGTGRQGGRKGKDATSLLDSLATPTKSGRTVGESILDAIRVESDDDPSSDGTVGALVKKEDAIRTVKLEKDDKIKMEKDDTVMAGVDKDYASGSEEGDSDTDGAYA